MRRATKIVFATACILLFAGCNRSNKGNAGPLSVDPVKLVRDCETLAKEGPKTWTASASLPVEIASLRPQVVTVKITDTPPATLVDIQLAGGFAHRGYIIVVTNQGTPLVPKVGRNWKISEVAPRVFEYNE